MHRGSIIETGKAWQLPVLVELPNIHPCFICAKSQLVFAKKYLDCKIKIVTLPSTWYLHSESCTVRESHLKSEPGRLSAKARRAKHINSLFKMQSLQEYKNTYNNLQYSPKIMHAQELLFASARSSSCGWLRVAWAWDLETTRFSLRLHDKKRKNFFAVTLWKERDRVRVSENAKWSERQDQVSAKNIVV